MSIQEFTELALSFPGTVSQPHFDRTAFKVLKGRIFTTLHTKSNTANVKLSPADQKIFCNIQRKAIYAVPNKWGLQGWTTFELNSVEKGVMLDALETAHKSAFNN